MKRVLKRIRRFRSFARALLRGAAYYVRHGEPVGKAAVGVVRSLTAPQNRKAPIHARIGRWRGCQKCELFDSTLQTCGDGVSLVVTSFGVSFPGGCQCWLPLKISDPEAECFRALIDESQWPDANNRPTRPNPAT